MNLLVDVYITVALLIILTGLLVALFALLKASIWRIRGLQFEKFTLFLKKGVFFAFLGLLILAAGTFSEGFVESPNLNNLLFLVGGWAFMAVVLSFSLIFYDIAAKIISKKKLKESVLHTNRRYLSFLGISVLLFGSIFIADLAYRDTSIFREILFKETAPAPKETQETYKARRLIARDIITLDENGKEELIKDFRGGDVINFAWAHQVSKDGRLFFSRKNQVYQLDLETGEEMEIYKSSYEGNVNITFIEPNLLFLTEWPEIAEFNLDSKTYRKHPVSQIIVCILRGGCPEATLDFPNVAVLANSSQGLVLEAFPEGHPLGSPLLYRYKDGELHEIIDLVDSLEDTEISGAVYLGFIRESDEVLLATYKKEYLNFGHAYEEEILGVNYDTLFLQNVITNKITPVFEAGAADQTINSIALDNDTNKVYIASPSNVRVLNLNSGKIEKVMPRSLNFLSNSVWTSYTINKLLYFDPSKVPDYYDFEHPYVLNIETGELNIAKEQWWWRTNAILGTWDGKLILEKLIYVED